MEFHWFSQIVFKKESENWTRWRVIVMSGLEGKREKSLINSDNWSEKVVFDLISILHQSLIDFFYSSILALIYAHKKCTIVDKEAVATLESRIKEERKRLTPNSAYHASLFLFLCGKYEKSRDYAEKTIKLHQDHSDSLNLKGWCELMMNQKSKSTLELFNRAINLNETMDAVLG